MLKFKRTYDGVDCNVLLVDTEGISDPDREASSSGFAHRLFTVTQMESQVLMFLLDGMHHPAISSLFADLTFSSARALRVLPRTRDIQASVAAVEYLIAVRVRNKFFFVPSIF